ncbi:hypothetical protein RA265_29900, partial [Pseudomonas syringae pv. tagetis]|uniref:hypothetical protein n=1 Tax=Pseudomonas syringae group genomosp. 7 TaxID=251699 RepID=UPI00376F4E27
VLGVRCWGGCCGVICGFAGVWWLCGLCVWFVSWFGCFVWGVCFGLGVVGCFGCVCVLVFCVCFVGFGWFLVGVVFGVV